MKRNIARPAAITAAPDPIAVYELQMILEARSHSMDVTAEAYRYTMDMTSAQLAIFDPKENEPDGCFACLRASSKNLSPKASKTSPAITRAHLPGTNRPERRKRPVFARA